MNGTGITWIDVDDERVLVRMIPAVQRGDSMSGRKGLVSAAAVLLLGAVEAGAQVPDHLDCYKIRDTIAKTSYTADLGGLAPASGCVIKLPGKLLCVATTKTNISPAPPGAAPGPLAGRFVCYKVKCRTSGLGSVSFTDQFGTRFLQPLVRKMLCAPESAPPSTSTTITTTTMSTTTNTGCGFPGSTCTVTPDCCVTPCIQGICQTCRMGGQSCNTTTDCCEGLCTDGVCAGPPGGP